MSNVVPLPDRDPSIGEQSQHHRFGLHNLAEGLKDLLATVDATTFSEMKAVVDLCRQNNARHFPAETPDRAAIHVGQRHIEVLPPEPDEEGWVTMTEEMTTKMWGGVTKWPLARRSIMYHQERGSVAVRTEFGLDKQWQNPGRTTYRRLRRFEAKQIITAAKEVLAADRD